MAKKKPEPKTIRMQPGESKRFMCNRCYFEFELLHEPKAVGDEYSQGFRAATVTCCPYCESKNIDDLSL